MVCVGLVVSLFHGALKIDISTLFTTFFSLNIFSISILKYTLTCEHISVRSFVIRVEAFVVQQLWTSHGC